MSKSNCLSHENWVWSNVHRNPYQSYYHSGFNRSKIIFNKSLSVKVKCCNNFKIKSPSSSPLHHYNWPHRIISTVAKASIKWKWENSSKFQPSTQSIFLSKPCFRHTSIQFRRNKVWSNCFVVSRGDEERQDRGGKYYLVFILLRCEIVFNVSANIYRTGLIS